MACDSLFSGLGNPDFSLFLNQLPTGVGGACVACTASVDPALAVTDAIDFIGSCTWQYGGPLRSIGGVQLGSITVVFTSGPDKFTLTITCVNPSVVVWQGELLGTIPQGTYTKTGGCATGPSQIYVNLGPIPCCSDLLVITPELLNGESFEFWYSETPVVNAGPDQVVVGQYATLSGSFSGVTSPHRMIPSWVQTAGPGTAIILGQFTLTPVVIMPLLGIYTFTLTVSDCGSTIAPCESVLDSVVITST